MLKERLITLIGDNEEILDMTNFITTVSWNDTRYDLAGLILKVSGYSLQLRGDGMPKLPLNVPLLDKKWLEYESEIGTCLSEYRDIPALARQLWDQDYGEKEAKRLPFYDSAPIPGLLWWDELSEVRPLHIIEFLSGDMPYNLNDLSEDDA